MTTSPNKSATFLLLTILLGAIALAVVTPVVPFVALSHVEEDIVHTRQKLTELRNNVARRRQSMLEGTPEVDTTVLLLNGGTTGIASANLQKRLNDLVIEKSGTPSRFQVWPPKEAGHFVRLDVSVNLQVDIDGLHKILYAIETGLPLLFIEDLVVRAPQSDGQTDNPYFLGPLEVTLRVSGWFLKQEST